MHGPQPGSARSSLTLPGGLGGASPLLPLGPALRGWWEVYGAISDVAGGVGVGVGVGGQGPRSQGSPTWKVQGGDCTQIC